MCTWRLRPRCLRRGSYRHVLHPEPGRTPGGRMAVKHARDGIMLVRIACSPPRPPVSARQASRAARAPQDGLRSCTLSQRGLSPGLHSSDACERAPWAAAGRGGGHDGRGRRVCGRPAVRSVPGPAARAHARAGGRGAGCRGAMPSGQTCSETRGPISSGFACAGINAPCMVAAMALACEHGVRRTARGIECSITLPDLH